tara:strand:+ start:262 stop:555 length:294 start_codon:yes stop_codon:yes gene_type:complete
MLLQSTRPEWFGQTLENLKMAKNKYAGMSKPERYRHHTQAKLVRMTTAEIMKLSPLAYAMDECGRFKNQWLYDCVADCVRNEKKIRAQQIRERMINA